MPRLLWLGPVLGLMLTGGLALASAGPPTGVFTAEQAAGGARAYQAQCAMCHGAKLLGPDAPALVGADVMRNFGTVAGLYDFITVAMPPQAPGKLRQEEYVAIVAYILSANGAKPGPAPLEADKARMESLALASLTAGVMPDDRGGGAGSAAPPAEDVPQAYTWGRELPGGR